VPFLNGKQEIGGGPKATLKMSLERVSDQAFRRHPVGKSKAIRVT
jgi:hypothetical protein